MQLSFIVNGTFLFLTKHCIDLKVSILIFSSTIMGLNNLSNRPWGIPLDLFRLPRRLFFVSDIRSITPFSHRSSTSPTESTGRLFLRITSLSLSENRPQIYLGQNWPWMMNLLTARFISLVNGKFNIKMQHISKVKVKQLFTVFQRRPVTA
jgi:hypothetical protein